MDKSSIETQLSPETGRTLYILDKSPHDDEVRIEDRRAPNMFWLGVAVCALLGVGVFSLVLNSKRPNPIERPRPEQERVKTLTEQLSSLTQTDLIVFSDGRVWYVRSVHGKNLEVVGWVGDNARLEDIGSFALKQNHVTIVRHGEAGWPAQRDKFLGQ